MVRCYVRVGAGVVIRQRGSSGVEAGRARPVGVRLGLETRVRRSVVVLFGGPSSTSAHSAGVREEGGRAGGFCLCSSVPSVSVSQPEETERVTFTGSYAIETVLKMKPKARNRSRISCNVI